MVTAIKTDNELKVGDGWHYQCKRCNYQVGIDKAFPETCPGCGAGGWWGQLVTTSDNGNLAKKIWGGDDIENSELKPLDKESHRKELCLRSFDATNQQPTDNNGVLTPVKVQGKRGPKFQATPDDIIKSLALDHDFGARKIAGELERRGFHINVRTISRRLVTLYTQKLPLFR